MPLTADHARQMLSRTADLARRMGDLAIEAANVATGLASRGTPAEEAFLEGLAEAGRLFTALRAEAFAAAASLDLPLPPLETVDSASTLEAMLRALLASVEAAERQAAAAAGKAAALAVLDRVARLTHRDHGDFEPLRACQAQARTLQAAIAQTGEIDAEAITMFAALLHFIDVHQELGDEEWGALQETVSGAFGSPLAAAAGRGRLVSAALTASAGGFS